MKMINIGNKKLGMQPAKWFPDNLHKLLLWTWLALEVWRVVYPCFALNFLFTTAFDSPLNISPELRISSSPIPYFISLFLLLLHLPLHFTQGLFPLDDKMVRFLFHCFRSFEGSHHLDCQISEITYLFLFSFHYLFISKIQFRGHLF